jgi:exopolyphosphatase / guanosine-5'-triphosphate,3'-diphosphate pyrophosphatase
MTTERFAAIDIGSNTVKLIIADREADGGFTAVLETSRAVRLGKDIHARRLGEPAIERTLAALEEFRELCCEHGVSRIAAVGTSALRDAANQEEFVERAAEVGVMVEAIPGEEEARLSFTAVRGDARWRDAEGLLVVDIGGGSTEVIVASCRDIDHRVSMPLGAVRLTEAALHSDPPTVQELDDANRKAMEALEGLQIRPANYTAVGVGGTFTNLAGIRLELPVRVPELIHGSTLTYSDVEGQIEMLAAKTVEERKGIVGLDPSRADVILGGAVILYQVLRKAGVEAISVSSRGLRWGLLYDRFGVAV